MSLINPDSNLYHSSSIYISHSSTHLISAPISSTLSSLLGETLGHDSVTCGRKTCISWRSAGQRQRSWGVLRSQVSRGWSQEIQDVSFLCPPKLRVYPQPWLFRRAKWSFENMRQTQTWTQKCVSYDLCQSSKGNRGFWAIFFFCSVILKWAIQFLLSYSLWTLAMCWGTLDLGSFNQGRPFWDLPRDQFLQDLEALHGTWMNIYFIVRSGSVTSSKCLIESRWIGWGVVYFGLPQPRVTRAQISQATRRQGMGAVEVDDSYS